ncbi:MAG: PH domain-containing protein [Micrococcales bacterium]|nr:PH domain-containing protein [Micrococcales bacterium]
MTAPPVPVPEKGKKAFSRYLAEGEEFVLLTRKHWITIAEPVATGAGSFVLMVVLIARMEQTAGDAAYILFLIWLVIAARTLYRIVEWRMRWFGSTKRRLMLQTGVIVRKMAMMPLEKVTDMNYAETPLGKVLGYGQYVMESAGQDQALRVVDRVPHSDVYYRILIGTMFGPKDEPATPAPQPEPAHDGLPEVPDWPPRYTREEWEAREREEFDQQKLERWEPVTPYDKLPPTFPPPGPAEAEPQAAPQPVPSDAPTQVIDITDPVQLLKDPWADAHLAEEAKGVASSDSKKD